MSNVFTNDTQQLINGLSPKILNNLFSDAEKVRDAANIGIEMNRRDADINAVKVQDDFYDRIDENDANYVPFEVSDPRNRSLGADKTTFLSYSQPIAVSPTGMALSNCFICDTSIGNNQAKITEVNALTDTSGAMNLTDFKLHANALGFSFVGNKGNLVAVQKFKPDGFSSAETKKIDNGVIHATKTTTYTAAELAAQEKLFNPDMGMIDMLNGKEKNPFSLVKNFMGTFENHQRGQRSVDVVAAQVFLRDRVLEEMGVEQKNKPDLTVQVNLALESKNRLMAVITEDFNNDFYKAVVADPKKATQAMQKVLEKSPPQLTEDFLARQRQDNVGLPMPTELEAINYRIAMNTAGKSMSANLENMVTLVNTMTKEVEHKHSVPEVAVISLSDQPNSDNDLHALQELSASLPSGNPNVEPQAPDASNHPSFSY